MIEFCRPVLSCTGISLCVLGTSGACTSVTLNSGSAAGGASAVGGSTSLHSANGSAGSTLMATLAGGASNDAVVMRSAGGAVSAVTGGAASTHASTAASGGSGGSIGTATAQSVGGNTGATAGGSMGTTPAGGSTATTGGSSTTSHDIGAAGSSSGHCESLVAALHGVVATLPNGLCRVSYDFSDAAQLLDWELASNTSTDLSLVNQLMVVTYVSAPSIDLAAVRFKLPLRPTRLAFQGTTIAGGHINAYLAVQWTGDWSPAFGYGFIHRSDGRLFTAAGSSFSSGDSTPLAANHTYTVEILMTSTRLVWTSDESSVSYDSVVIYQGKDRHIALGGWTSTVAFDDVVIEGEF